MKYPIYTDLENLKKNYDTTVPLVTGLPFSQKKTIRMIEFYTNSKYLLNQRDELGREKPFMQISNAICDVENAAKDIDTKDITVTSDDAQHYTESMLMTKDIYQWMKDANFAKTLNNMRDTHTRYGSLLVKKVEITRKDGKKDIDIQIPEWKNTITDQVNITDMPIIEVHFMTPYEMVKMTKDDAWNKENVKKAIEVTVRDKSGKRIPVYEIRGWFPKHYINLMEGNKSETSNQQDETDFSYQLYYIAGSPEEFQEGVADLSFTEKLIPLYWEDDTEECYKYLSRKPRAGRAFGVGVVEEGEEAQVWTNDAVLKQFRAMEYTTKVIGQTASKKLKGRNLLTETDDGQVLEHEDGKPITPINLLPSGGLQQYSMLLQQWYDQFQKTTSAYAAQRGETPPSGTPFRLQAQVLQQSSSVFQDLQEELGVFITEIFTDWILPYKAKQLNQEHILAHEFNANELREIDKNFSTKVANDRVKEMILSGKIVTPEDYDLAKEGADTFIKQTKDKRFIKIPKDYYKTMNAKITVNVTGEQKNKAAILESLVSILTTYNANPNLAQDPVGMEIFMRLVELSGAGISPISLSAALVEKEKQLKNMQAQMPQEPQPEPEPLTLEAQPA